MANLTITVDDNLLQRARIRALEQGTSVNAVLREYLEAFTGQSDLTQARGRLVELARRSSAGSGSAGRSWRREDIYDRGSRR